MGSLRRILALTTKELRQLARDRITFAMIVGIPALQLVLFGYAINFDVRGLSAAVSDEAQTTASRALVLDIAHSQVVEIRRQVASAAELEALVAKGDVRVGILVPHDFERRLLDDQRRPAQLLIDGSDPVLLGVADRIAAMAHPRVRAPPRSLFEVRAYFNPERLSAVNTVPGLIGVILTLTMVLFTAIALVRERERGNLELLITTPIRTPELMVAKILPYVGIGLLQVTIILWLGQLLFQVPVRGTLSDVYLAALLFVTSSLSLGLLISTVSQTQFQAMQLTLFLLLPSILISGFVFPFEGMPRIVQHIAEALPMTHFIRVIKGLMLRGTPIAELWEPVAALAGITFVTMTLAMLRFRKRLD